MMHKILILLTTVLIFNCAYASESAIRQAMDEYIQAIVTLDIKRANAICHPDYRLITSNGRELDMTHANRVAKLISIVRDSSVSNVKLLDVLEAAAMLTDSPLTEETRQTARQLEGTFRGKIWILSKKPLFIIAAIRLNKIRKQYSEALSTFKILDCSINGKCARLSYEMRAVNSNIMELNETEWVKSDGKWLILKTVSRKLDTK